MDGISLGAGLAALGFWLFVAGTVAIGVWDGIRKRDAQHETLRRLAESGQPLDEALLDKVFGGGRQQNLRRDLKIAGIIMLFIVPGFLLLGLLIGAPYVMGGVGALVGMVGVGLLVAARTVDQDQ